MEPAALLVKCEDLLKGFNPVIWTLDAYVAARIGEAQGDFASSHNVFLKQVVYGCVRYKQALKVAIASFYYNNSSKASRSDYTMYLILAYLAVFRLEEMGFQEFSKFVGSQPAEKMHVFLSYFFNAENLHEWVKDEWIKIFDFDYVENTIIATLLKHESEVNSLCKRMSARAFGVSGSAGGSPRKPSPQLKTVDNGRTELISPEERRKSYQPPHQQNKGAPGRRKSINGVPEVLSKPPTIPEPFRLTKQRPPCIPEPMRINQGTKSSGSPNPGFETFESVTLEELQKTRVASKERALREVAEKHSKCKGPNLVAAERADRRRQINHQQNNNNKYNNNTAHNTLLNRESPTDCRIEDGGHSARRSDASGADNEHENNSARDKIVPFKANPVPDFSRIPAIVKTNTSTILREDALYKRKQFQEAQLLKQYEEDLRDSVDYFTWQNKMKEADEVERLKLVGERRENAVKSMEDARKALANQRSNNHQSANEMKATRKEIQDQLEEEINEVVIGKQQLVTEVRTIRKIAPRRARQRVRKQNEIESRRIKQAQVERHKRKQEEDAKEQERRNDLIRRIKALERVRDKMVVKFDPTETPGHGLLEEMSLVELKERLATNQVRERANEEEARTRILQKKREKEDALRERIANIQAARHSAAQVNRQTWEKRAEDRRSLELKKQQILKTKQKELVVKLEKSREERIAGIRKLQEEEAVLMKKKLFLGEAKNAGEATVHEQFLLGAEREAREKQRVSQLAASAAEAIVRREKLTRGLLAQTTHEEKEKKMAADHAKHLREAHQFKVDQFEVINQKKATVEQTRAEYHQHIEKYRLHNRYGTEMFHGSIPVRVLQNMNASQVREFFEGREEDAKHTLEGLLSDSGRNVRAQLSSSRDLSHNEKVSLICETISSLGGERPVSAAAAAV